MGVFRASIEILVVRGFKGNQIILKILTVKIFKGYRIRKVGKKHTSILQWKVNTVSLSEKGLH